MGRKKKLRFAFTIPAGPNAGLTSGSWRVWTNGEDTYIAAAALGHMWKASLHGDIAWRIAVTSENVLSDDPVLPSWHDRAPWKFAPTKFAEGRRLAFAIGVLRGALGPYPLDVKDLHIAVDDRWDQVTVGYIWMTEPGVDLGQVSRLVGDPLSLASGRRVWLVAGTEEIPGGEPEPQAAGSMIEPRLPETHEVSAPGFLVRGVHLG
jgi:hypothetical protein